MTPLHLHRIPRLAHLSTARLMARLPALLFVCAMAPASWAQAQVGDVGRGATLYGQRCSACHAVDHNGVGPAHRGLFERQAGQAPGYAYSPALKASKLRWTSANLERWLADPEQLVPGQKMGVSVSDRQERADLIAYLKSLPEPSH